MQPYRKLTAFQRIGESLAGNAVDACIGRSSYGFVAALSKLFDEPRPNESSTANYHDFHCLSFPPG